MKLGENVDCVPGTLISLPLIFLLQATSISHFLTAAIKFLCYGILPTRLVSFVVRVAMRFTAETRGHLKCKISPRLTLMRRGGRTYERAYGRFSQNQNFLDA